MFRTRRTFYIVGTRLGKRNNLSLPIVSFSFTERVLHEVTEKYGDRLIVYFNGKGGGTTCRGLLPS